MIATSNPYISEGTDCCAHELLQARVSHNPAAVAVSFEGKSLTYKELEDRSNQFARVLSKHGTGREARVGICVERSTEMVVALLGILKSGGAYVPIDPTHGSGRIEHIVNDCGFGVLVTHKSLLGLLPPCTAKILLLDEWNDLAAGESSQPFASDAKPSDLAYILYTSGSTGKPKGVQIEHRSLVNFLRSMQREPGFLESDTILAVTTLAFDIAGLEMFLPLFAGGRILIAGRNVVSDGRSLMQLLKTSGATVMQATPATWRLLFESGWRGDPRLKVLVGGDTLSAELGKELVSHCGEVWNMYGPTETTIWSSIYRVTGREERLVPIGRPIANTELYVRDSELRPVAPGQEGELCIGGAGLARGYFQRPQLTSEKFAIDPSASEPDARLYRTGDLARYGPDGQLYFLGRIDHQVKIRGFRVEPGEIEATLNAHPHVRNSVVVAREDRPGEKHLVAYLVADWQQTVTPAQLRAHLGDKLPEYMVPGAFVLLPALPLTPNGKLDRAALPMPQGADFQTGEAYFPPRDATERKLVEIWESILNVRPIGIKTSFFDLGGKSLLAARLFMRMLPEFGKDLPISTLFRSPTIEQLACELRAPMAEKRYQNLVPIKTAGTKRPFFCVHGGLGSTLFLRSLAAHLDHDQPFYAIESDGLDGGPIRHPSIESMAAHYNSEIRRVQPEGPYIFGGYCFGGLVAFEMAQQFLRNGERVALLAHFSAPLRFNGPAQAVAKEPSQPRLLRLARAPIKDVWLAIRIRVAMRAYRLISGLRLRVPQRMRTQYISRILFRAELNYVPKPYAGKLVLFYGKDPSYDMPYMGWNGLAQSYETHLIGDAEVASRREIMSEPLVRQLAAQLTVCLDGASEEQQAGEMAGGSHEPVRGKDMEKIAWRSENI